MGGLSKKAFQLETIGKMHQVPTLALDGGNLLFKEERLSPGLLQQAKITAEGIVDSYSFMGYDAVAVGGRDLTGGLSFLQAQAERSEFTWLSANLVRKKTMQPIFFPSLVRRAGSLTVGIIGLTGEGGALHFPGGDDALLLNWRRVLPDLVTDLASRCDLLVLLSNYSPDENREIARVTPEIHLIIQSSPRSKNQDPELENNSLILQTGKQGKYLGWMLINWQKSKKWGREDTTRELVFKKQELDGINGRIRRIERRESREDLLNLRSYQNLIASRENLLSEIIFLENELHVLIESGQAPATFENHFIALKENLPDQPAVQKIVDSAKSRVNVAGSSQAGSSATASPPPELQPETLVFTGWLTCALCHGPQTAFWKETGHSSAYQTLVSEEQQFNLDCLPCHVTAQYKETLISSNDVLLLSLPAHLQQVGCEVCHGTGKKHAASQNRSDISRKPDEAVCRRCHTPERDENFNYENDILRIACPASGSGQ